MVVLRYLHDNPGAVFIISFMLLMICTAVLLTSGASELANEAAIAAYCVLIVGIALEVISYMRESKTRKSQSI